MPTPTYTPIANVTLASSATTITFSSISQAYRDLIIVYQVASTSSTESIIFQFNGDTGANYYRVYMVGNGSSASSTTTNNSSFFAGFADTASLSQANIMQVNDYSANDKHKTVLLRVNPPGTYTLAAASRWSNTSAVTSILCRIDGGLTMAAGTNIAIYGVAA